MGQRALSMGEEKVYRYVCHGAEQLGHGDKVSVAWRYEELD